MNTKRRRAKYGMTTGDGRFVLYTPMRHTYKAPLARGWWKPKKYDVVPREEEYG